MISHKDMMGIIATEAIENYQSQEKSPSPTIAHTCESSIVCPHCGYRHMDSWEFPDVGETDCAECNKRFSYYRDIVYSTEKVNEPK